MSSNVFPSGLSGSNCASVNFCDKCATSDKGDCDACLNNDCLYIKRDGVPAGASMIKGSGQLIAISETSGNVFGPSFPSVNNSLYPVVSGGTFPIENSRCREKDPRVGTSAPCYPNPCVTPLVQLAQGICPPVYCGTVCISKCCDYKAAEFISYIDGDLVIYPHPESYCAEYTGVDCADKRGFDRCLDQGDNISGVRTPFDYLKRLGCRKDLISIFPNLLGVNGSIYVIGTNYRKISGFDRLEYVTGDIYFIDNPNMISMPTFNSLVTVGRNNHQTKCNEKVQCHEKPGRIIIGHNDSLRKVAGFEALRQVAQGIYIMDNNCLSHICGFINLLRTKEIVIHQNATLCKILGFCYVESVQELLQISRNNTQGDYTLGVDAFHTLDYAGNVTIYDNHYLKTVCFPKLVEICGTLGILFNSSLEEIRFAELALVGSIVIEYNRKLLDIHFDKLRAVKGGIYIQQNDGLVTLNTFHHLRSVEDSINIVDNHRLCQIKGFEVLAWIGSKNYLLERKHEHDECDEPEPCCTPWEEFCPPKCYKEPCCEDLPEPFDESSDDESDTSEEPKHKRTTPAPIARQPSSDDIKKPDHKKSCTPCLNYCDDLVKKPCLPCSLSQFLCFPETKCAPCYKKTDPCEKACVHDLSVSIIIYDNNNLRSIDAFHALKSINSSIYIIKNKALHTIKAFDCLTSATDIWIRNNTLIKNIFGFNSLRFARNIVILETVCLENLDSLESLEHAEYILIEAKSSNSVKGLKTPKLSVSGFIIYYTL